MLNNYNFIYNFFIYNYSIIHLYEIMKSNCLKKNGKINYLKYIGLIFSYKYLTNTTLYLLIFFMLFKKHKLLHALIPLAITNGIFIVYYILFYFKKIDEESIKKICNFTDADINNDKKQAKKLINKLTTINKPTFIVIQIIIHFWILLLIYILKKKNYILHYEDKKSSFIDGLLFTLFIIFKWFILSKKNLTIYEYIGINKDNILNVALQYIICHMGVLFIYYNL